MDNNLDKIAEKSLYQVKTGILMQDYTFELIKRYFDGNKDVLELGPAEGTMTRYFSSYFNSLDVVEGSGFFCKLIKSKYPRVNVYNEYFESFYIDKKYDLIILGHVLEHVNDPVSVLENINKMLKNNGKIFCAVPNSNSLHRQAAVIMGILDVETSMSEKDYHHGHKRVFDSSSFRSVFNQAKFNIEHFGGYWLKPLSDIQLESWSDEMIMAFMKLGERYPDIAAENYVIASRKNES